MYDGPLTRSILAPGVRQADTQIVRLFARGSSDELPDQRWRAHVGLRVNRAITYAEGDLVRCQGTVADSREAWGRGEIRTEKFQGIVREIRDDGSFVEEARPMSAPSAISIGRGPIRCTSTSRTCSARCLC
jgi:hypothetical protein